jgi:CheY-like chemotaxis protein
VVNHHHGRLSVTSEGVGRGSTFRLQLLLAGNKAPDDAEADHSSDNIESVHSIVGGAASASFSRTLSEPLSSPSMVFPESSDSLAIVNLRTALVVDDSAMCRRLMIVSLRGVFGRVLQAGDGVEAVIAVRNALMHGERIDVILMDYVMPNMNGPMATAQIRALGYTGKIFGVTGNMLPRDVDSFTRSGANRVFGKPLELRELLQALEGTHRDCFVV